MATTRSKKQTKIENSNLSADSNTEALHGHLVSDEENSDSILKDAIDRNITKPKWVSLPSDTNIRLC